MAPTAPTAPTVKLYLTKSNRTNKKYDLLDENKNIY